MKINDNIAEGVGCLLIMIGLGLLLFLIPALCVVIVHQWGQ